MDTDKAVIAQVSQATSVGTFLPFTPLPAAYAGKHVLLVPLSAEEYAEIVDARALLSATSKDEEALASPQGNLL
jgi:hypothetical protein